MNITTFFRDVLGAELRNQVWSWGAIDEDQDRLFLRIWEDQIRNFNGSERVRVDIKSAKSSAGRNERRTHIDLIKQGLAAYGVVCRAVDPDTPGERRIKDFDESPLLVFDEILDDGDDVYASIRKRVPLDVITTVDSEAKWHLKPGDKIKRKDLHQRYGGRSQGGIGPSAKTPNVFLFSDPASGEQHGYVDDWQPDGYFHYTGEGQLGDQRLNQGNLAVLNAAKDGRALRLFKGTGGTIEYEDQVSLDPKEPYYLTDAPETGGGPIRSVIVFKLKPLTKKPREPKRKPARDANLVIDDVPIEAQFTEKAVVEPNREEYEAERRESSMVQRYKAFIEAQGHPISRLRIRPPNEAMPMFCDVYVKDLNLLVEAKGSTDRQSIRMAIGQLVDYGRFVPGGTQLAILLPSRPREDLVRLIEHAEIKMIYEDGDSFEA